jgi:hypothetical protein
MTFDPSKPISLPLRTEPSSRDSSGTKDARLINGYQEKQPDSNEIAVYKRPGYALYGGYAFGNTGFPGGFHFSASVGKALVVYSNNPSGGNALYDAFTGAGIGTMSGTSHYPITYFGDYLNGTFIQNVEGNTGLIYYYYNGATFANVAGPTSSFPMVPGVVVLDGTIYMMDLSGKIWGSNVNDPTVWGTSNFIQSSTYSTLPTFLARQKVYIIAFSAFETNVFFDAGNATGSPLSPLPGGKAAVGCCDYFSVQTMGDEIVWVGQIPGGVVGVFMMRDLRIQKISTGSIDRILSFALSGLTFVQSGNSSHYFTSWQTSVEGHRLYVLNLLNQSFSLVYDFDSGDWYEWQLDSGGVMPFLSTGQLPAMAGIPAITGFSGIPTGNGQGNIIQGPDARIYNFDAQYTTDNGASYTLTLVTDNWDGGVRYKKFLPRIDFDADQQSNSTISVSYTEDDYQTFSNPRTVDLSQAHPFLINCGSFRRRAYKIVHSAATPLRLYAMNMSLQIGSK